MDCQNSVCLNFLHELLTWGKIPCNSVSDLLAFLHHSLLSYRELFFLMWQFILGITSSFGEGESTGGLSAFRNVGKVTKDSVLGTASAPIHMVASEGGHFKEQLWRTFRTIALAFLLISGVGALIEDRGISKGICLDTSGATLWIRFYARWNNTTLRLSSSSPPKQTSPPSLLSLSLPLSLMWLFSMFQDLV